MKSPSKIKISEDSRPNFWMAVESRHNWQADAKNEFRFLGVSEFSAQRATEVKRDDVMFVYVSKPKSAFADIRVALKDGLHRSPHTKAYDVPCYGGIVTKPLVVLEMETWLPIKTIIGGLSFLHLAPGWGNALRRSFRKLKGSDAQTILNAMTKLNPGTSFDHIRQHIETSSANAKDKVSP